MAEPKKTQRRRKRASARLTVVIPVLNESRTIARVVKFALRDRLVGEVLVLDDGSIDGSPELAEAAGARVITSTMMGKGVSMEDGLQAARYALLLYLDGDLRGLRRGLITEMARPLLEDRADFVKARFTRSAGRVTELTARPLLRTYFPELAEIAQPLGGIIAARRDLLRQLRFENDYGVDIGLLIDAAAARARIEEVDIGPLKHDSQPLTALGEMATQVARTILERAAAWGRLRVSFIREARERDRLRRTDFRQALNMLRGAEKLALFDMDGTLLNGRFVIELAQHSHRMEQLMPLLDNHDLDAAKRSRRIAAVFKGVPKQTFERVAREAPLMPGAVETVVNLRKAGYLVGIVTDSYRVAAETVRRRVFADFSIANVMKFRGDKATGRVTLAPVMRHRNGCEEHTLCKLNVLRHFLDELGIGPERVLAVGDNENDTCMLRAAGISIAFNPKSANVRAAGRHVVEEDLRGVLRVIGEPFSNQPEMRPMPVPAED